MNKGWKKKKRERVKRKKKCNIKGLVMQTEKALTKDRLLVSTVSRKICVPII